MIRRMTWMFVNASHSGVWRPEGLGAAVKHAQASQVSRIVSRAVQTPTNSAVRPTPRRRPTEPAQWVASQPTGVAAPAPQQTAAAPAAKQQPQRNITTQSAGPKRPRPRRTSDEPPSQAPSQPALAATPTAAPRPPAQQQSRKLLLIDGHGLAFRAYWGIFNSISRKGGPQTLSTSDGIPTTVTFGFLRSLQVLLEEERPDALIVAFDAPQKSFRHDMLSEYKSNRAKAPPGFGADLRNLQQLLHFMRVSTVVAPGYEADDVIGGVAQTASKEGYAVRIYSSDMDLYQVVDDAANIAVLRPAATNKPAPRSKAKGPSTTLIDEAGVRDRMGIQPKQAPDFKALAGDSSDNVPGIAGIGPKTAADLLAAYGSVEAVFQQLDAVKKGAAGKLQGKEQEVAKYKDITILRPEAVNNVQLDLSGARLSGFNTAEVEPLVRRLELMTVVKDLPKLQQLMGGAAASTPELAAAVPAALEQLAECITTQQQETTSAVDGNGIDGGSSADSSRSRGMAGIGATADGTATPNAAAGLSSVLPAPRGGPLPAAVSSLPNNLQERMPDVLLVSTQQQLQQLVEKLQQHKGVTSWLWPQDADYRPGIVPPLPSYICCTWDELATGQQVMDTRAAAAAKRAAAAAAAEQAAAAAMLAAANTMASTNTSSDNSNDSSSKASAASRRRRRTTAAATSMQEAVVAAAAAPPPAQVELQPQQPMLQQVQLDPNQQYYMPQLAVVAAGEELPCDAVLSALKPLFEDAAKPKVMFESKRCYTELRHWGVKLAGVEFDVLVAGCLLDPERWKESSSKSKGALEPLHQQQTVLPAMTQEVLNTSLPDLSRALTTFQQQQQGVPTQKPDAEPYWASASSVWALHALRSVYERELRQLDDGGKLLKLLQDVEVPVQRVLSDMEYTGLGMDRELLLRQKQELQAVADSLEAKLFELAGRKFNLQSRQELSRVTYDELQLKPRDPNYQIPETTTGFKSTGIEHIEKLEDSPFKTSYKEWLYHNTLLTRYYVPSYMDAATPETGRVHTILHQVGGATGRINSSHPNLQNLPMHDPRAHEIRQAFNVPAEGYVLVSADYSQVELRVLAAMSGDAALQEAMKGDVHSATARVLLGRGPEDSITPEERQLGKRVNFSIAYGAGGRKLAADVAIFAGDIGFTEKDGKMMLDKFFAAYPGLYDYMTNNQRSGVARGYTQSYLGRRRLFRFQAASLQRLLGTSDLSTLPDMKGLRRLARTEADAAVLRQAGNAPIQGTSADVLKLALLELDRKLTGPPHNCRLVLTVHDEAVMEVPKDQWPAVTAEIQQIMEGVLPLMLKVDVQEGW